MYEAGFRGFTLHDQILADGWKCFVTLPHMVTQEKCSRLKNDLADACRLTKNLENNDYTECFVHERQHREDRQIPRLYDQIQQDIVRVCNRIRRSLEYHGLDHQITPE